MSVAVCLISDGEILVAPQMVEDAVNTQALLFRCGRPNTKPAGENAVEKGLAALTVRKLVGEVVGWWGCCHDSVQTHVQWCHYSMEEPRSAHQQPYDLPEPFWGRSGSFLARTSSWFILIVTISNKL
jgi:hypothetical protein